MVCSYKPWIKHFWTNLCYLLISIPVTQKQGDNKGTKQQAQTPKIHRHILKIRRSSWLNKERGNKWQLTALKQNQLLQKLLLQSDQKYKSIKYNN